MRSLRDWFTQQCIVHVGSNRVVLEIPHWGVVVKFPIVHGIALLCSIRGFIRGTSFVSFSHWLRYPMESEGFLGFKRLVFKGITDNWREYWFWVFERHPFVQPTYFSLFGLVNVQRRGDPLTLDQWEFRYQLEQCIGERVLYSDAHHFASIKNFCIVDGAVRMVDYGSKRTQRIIRERGICAYVHFYAQTG